jgi:ParB-like chromosome segregation protein Spo0J
VGHLLADIEAQARALARRIEELPLAERVIALNHARAILHDASPFKGEPVDLVEWVPADAVDKNDYNPNSCAPPELRLLHHSVEEDGFTQPVVTWAREQSAGEAAPPREVVDGFHRKRVAQENARVRERLGGYLPVTTVNRGRAGRADRIAATIRHNRARGKHAVTLMSEIVQELARRNWSSDKIAKELGMSADEVLRLKQLSGLAELFADREFSRAWELPRRDEQ